MSTAKKANARSSKPKVAAPPERHLTLVPPIDDGTMAYTCRCCGKKNTVQRRAQVAGGYQAVECPNCTVNAVQPLPNAKMVKEYYGQKSSIALTDFAKNELVYLQARIAEALIQTQAHRKNPAFLDFGFGNGAFIRHMLTRGIRVTGVEVNSRDCEQLAALTQNEAKPPVIINASEESYTKRLGSKRFNCITMFQTLDYVADPLKTVKELCEMQKTGDVLYLECTNEKSFAVKIKNFFSKSFFHREKFFGSLNPPQKFHGFNKTSLTALLDRAGYDVKEMNNYPFRDNLRQVDSPEQYPSIGEWSYLPERFSTYQLARTFIGTFDRWFAKVGRGGGLYALAVKRSNKQ